MTTLAKQFGLIFFAGLVMFFVALMYGSMVDDLVGDQPGLSALRWLGLGLMAAGLTLWIVARRAEAGKAGLNPLFGFLLGTGCLLLLINLLFPTNPFSSVLSLGGIGLVGGALAAGVIVSIVAPAYPRPLTARWPEGGEADAAEGKSGDAAH